MIDHEFAKELKRAGFKQPIGSMYALEGDIQSGFEIIDETAYVPTLSELIEACVDVRFWLRNDTLTEAWTAYGDPVEDLAPGYVGNGSTPEEAVARLWLALNPTQI